MTDNDDVERVARAVFDTLVSQTTGRAPKHDYDDTLEDNREAARDLARAALSAMPSRLSPELIAQLTALASRLTQMGEYEAVDLIDTVVARVSAMPQRELLAEAEVERVDCDRVETVIKRCENMGWVTVYDKAPFAATLRIALDTEVEAGGPYLNNGHNRRAALSAMPERELLREALEALQPFANIAKEPFAHRDLRRARAAADKIRAALTQEPQT